jgi:hypothetical protein
MIRGAVRMKYKVALKNIEDAIREYLSVVDEQTRSSEVREVEVVGPA